MGLVPGVFWLPSKIGVLGTQRLSEQQKAGRNPGLHVFKRDLGGLFGRQSLDAGVKAALVAGGGVGVENALLHALVEGGGGCLVLLSCGLDVARVEGLAQRAEAASYSALVGAVDRGSIFGLTDALERGDMVCHGGSELFSGIWDAGKSTSPAIDKFTGLRGKRQGFGARSCGQKIP